MREKTKNILTLILILGTVFALSLWGVLKPADAFSDAERRKLAQRPELSLAAVKSGSYMADFESYVLDQFTLRDSFIALKSAFSHDILAQRDVNGYYSAQGHASRIEYPLRPGSIENAADKFEYLFRQYLGDESIKVYISLIPDKNTFLAPPNGYPAIDFAELVDLLRSRTDSFAQYIDISSELSLDSFYYTDTHWRQEKLIPAAEKISAALGADIYDSYDIRTLTETFKGVYSGKTPLRSAGEPLCCLDSGAISACRVYDYETQSYIPVYDFEKAQGKDPYEIFLSGSKSLLRIENPAAAETRRLIIFRDSFGSSIAPLFIPAYSEIVLIDIRYLPSQMLGRMLDFENADVLFLYSSQVLNNSETLK